MTKLFSEFPPVSTQQWEEKILKDLQLSSISELFWHTPEHLDIRPFYTHEHLQNIHVYPASTHHQWDIVQYIPISQLSEEELNEQAIKSLNSGASGLSFDYYSNKNFSKILHNISLPHIYSNFQISFDNLHILEHLYNTYHSVNEYTKKKNCFINIDPIFLFEKFGEWHQHKDKDFLILNELNHIPVNATLYKESGAHTIQELAYTLAHLNEYLYFLENKKQLHRYSYIHIQVSIGPAFFTEIAKLRALRILISHLLAEYHHTAKLHIHTQTTLLNKTYLDIYNNLIRTTTEAMSAIFGGANSISILPFDFPFEKISDFSLRMARNQLIIMREESYLQKTADVALGNFYIENYTNLLTQKAYQKFLEIEKQNGLIHLLEQNYIQKEIQDSFEEQLKQYIKQKHLLIGVNKYPPPQQEKKASFFYHTTAPSSPLALIPKRYAEYFEKQLY